MSEGSVYRLVGRRAFARFRRRRMCVIEAGTRRDPARLRDISAAGATLDTNARPPLGEAVRLHHPEAGEIAAHVSRHTREGVGLSFEVSDASVSFAMLALATDMTEA
ncbi:PilZ domain-containing protein [Sphingoaurantiacus capsulatus]|uniref:PilZ domain-containing protein n=1 Tax=Sphingoaurantiacus capsulatus TaxID=1771310 RepID=A0ABV7XAG3_9SPHN